MTTTVLWNEVRSEQVLPPIRGSTILSSPRIVTGIRRLLSEQENNTASFFLELFQQIKLSFVYNNNFKTLTIESACSTHGKSQPPSRKGTLV